MDLWLWSLCFLPVFGAQKILPEVKLEGMLGGSVTIECPLPVMHVRLYLCREMAGSGVCATVVSNSNFVKEEYKHRVTLTPYPDRNLFLVEVTELARSDSGVYACGAGKNTDRGKTQQVTLNVHSEYKLLWEEEPMPESPPWLQRLLNMQIPPWFQMPAHASSFEFISKVTTPAQRTEAPPAHHPSPTTPITHRPRVSRASSVAAAKPTTLLLSTTASKTSVQEGLLRPQTASYNHHNRLHRQRGFNHGPVSGTEEQGFHILIPTILGLILLALLGLVVKRVIQRRRALSRGVRRLAVRMRALEASHWPRVSQRPRSQNNIYSACPRRAWGANAAGEGGARLPGPGASARPAPDWQVSEAPWPYAPSLKTSCEYVSFYHQPAATMEDTGSDDYVNIPCLTHLSSCPPGPKPWCQ
ncbi:PREDICTED: fas apoptotic inhibitory molecule 3 [Ceratotherium simum simum]|uniref:Fas apoptotic inhibitory molecule 3 n=1 Tax=Ceratotherium simum simum TaxID=73337 RepID=A0ABM0HE99_CERSS|nr:PREDICTED: fas apoptotic inhibitory molecule 3 [Ceratotherium simum simum]